MSKSKVFYYSCLFFIFGIALASFANFDILKYELFFFLTIMLFLIITIVFWHNFKFRFVALLGLFLFLGIWRYASFLPDNSVGNIQYYNGQYLSFNAQVISEPDWRAYNQKLLIGKIKINKGNKEGKILLTLDRYPEYNYGDILDIQCKLTLPEPFNGFAYDRYLARHDVYSLCYYPKVELKSSAKGNFVFELIYKFKNYTRAIFNKNLDEPYSALAKAMTLGDKQGLSAELRETFSRAGISHIIAISGMHIGIITTIVLLFLGQIGLGRRTSYFIASTFLFLFIMMVGMPVSAVRAGIMGFLVLTAFHLGRLNQLKYSLLIVAFVLLLANPLLLRDDIGWQLSFLAVLGIAYFFPLINFLFEKFVPDKLRKFKIIQTIFVIINITLSANIATAPIVVYNFGIMSLVSPLTNLLVLWILPFLFILFGLGLTFSFLPNLSFLIFKLAQALLYYIVLMSDKLSQIPYAYSEMNIFNWQIIIIYYLLLIFILFIIKRRKV